MTTQETLEILYDDSLAMYSRYVGLIAGVLHSGEGDCNDELRLFSAPGRTEIGGNHTDHNHGKVMAASINLDIAAVVTIRDTQQVLFRSTGHPDVFVDLNNLEPDPAERGTTESLIRGIAAEFIAQGTPVGGWTAYADSLVSSGSGLSSSAALEVLFGRIFDNLYGNGRRSALDIAQIGQKAENNYFGKPSGLMDQAACASGGVVAIDFADPAKPLLNRVVFDLASAGLSLCIVDTRGSHADLTPDYAAIPGEMKAVATFFGKSVLRELDADTVLANTAELRKHVGDRAVLRALHFFNENRRVDALVSALEKNDSAAYLTIVQESGDSSWELLQNIYSPSHATEQGIGLALALTREFFPGCGCACRVHGGGFAGTIQSYLPTDLLPIYRERMDAVFGTGSVTELKIRQYGAIELPL
jgi:galactokinase